MTIQVYCDMETDGGGWTVFQRRQDGTQDFYRGWDHYVIGFGNLTGEFWLGLEKIHRLTKRNVTTLRVDLADFQGNTRFAKYDTFRVLNSFTDYRLNVAGYTGTAGDSMTNQNGQQFSTKDRDNDVWYSNCAIQFSGAWWYRSCHYSNLNGLYNGSSATHICNGVHWYTWNFDCTSLKFTEIKLG